MSGFNWEDHYRRLHEARLKAFGMDKTFPDTKRTQDYPKPRLGKWISFPISLSYALRYGMSRGLLYGAVGWNLDFPGVYQIQKGKEVYYIGSAGQVGGRISGHFNPTFNIYAELMEGSFSQFIGRFIYDYLRSLGLSLGYGWDSHYYGCTEELRSAFQEVDSLGIKPMTPQWLDLVLPDFGLFTIRVRRDKKEFERHVLEKKLIRKIQTQYNFIRYTEDSNT